MTIRAVRVTPIAFRDPPLLNVVGIHEPYALRSILEVETGDGFVGLGETYGDSAMLEGLRAVAPQLVGLDPFDLNGLRRIVGRALAAGAATATGGEGLSVAPGTLRRNLPVKVEAAFEVALLDLQGQLLGRPLVDLLGGAVRDRVPYSAYLFYKYGRHRGLGPEHDDPWGEALDPAGIVAQARRMRDAHGFASIKLKAGVFEPEREAEALLALADAFPGLPLRIDPNGGWSVETSVRMAGALAGTLEYLEDPTPGLAGMGEVAARIDIPLATNMVVTGFEHLPESIRLGSAQVVLADHHYWGGLRATQHLATICATWGIGVSMHSNSHLGISLAAMTHVAASVPELTYACDTHYPWQVDEVVEGGKLRFEGGALRVPSGPGLGVRLDRDALALLHETYLACGIRDRDDVAEMRKYRPDWTGALPRF
jgi:glucarate dehydratase